VFSLHSVQFVNLYYTLLAKAHAAVHVCVLCLYERDFLVSFHKTLKQIYAYSS